MTSRFDLITIDTPDTDNLAGFWCAALGLVETEREDGDRWLVLSDATTGTRRIGLQKGVHAGGGTHLDLVCEMSEFAAEVERLVGLGARLVRPVRTEPYGHIANLADPDGNVFDLNAYAS